MMPQESDNEKEQSAVEESGNKDIVPSDNEDPPSPSVMQQPSSGLDSSDIILPTQNYLGDRENSPKPDSPDSFQEEMKVVFNVFKMSLSFSLINFLKLNLKICQSATFLKFS